MDDRTGTKEQKRLEEAVRHQVEDTRRISRHAAGKEHIAQLRTGRIGNDALDVVLNTADGRGEERSRRTNDGHDHQGGFSIFKDRRQTRDHEYTGRHHGCRVNKGGNRGRAFHCVGKPGVQTKLCRFTHRTDEQQEAGDLEC